MQTKTIEYHYTSLRMGKIQNTATPNAGEDMEKQELSFIPLGVQNGKDTWEDILAVSYKSKHTLTIPSNKWAPWYLPKGAADLCPHKNLHTHAGSSFIHNCPNSEATKILSIGEWMNKLVHPDNGIFFSAKRKWVIKPWKDMEESWMCITKWKKPIWEGYKLYDSNNMTFWKRQNYGGGKKFSGCQGLRGGMNRQSTEDI